MRRGSIEGLVALVVAGGLVLPACSGGDDASTTTQPFGAEECEASEPSLAIDQIDDAVAAVEAERGGPQQYFEINATPLLVNLFVADAEASTVTPYAYVAGELSSQPVVEGASGNSFAASAIAVDPQRVLSCVTDQLPASTLDVFFVEGGPEGSVRYTVLTSNEQGGQLVIEVTAVGLVLSVDPV